MAGSTDTQADAGRLSALNERVRSANFRGAWIRDGAGRAPEAQPWAWRWSEMLPCLLEAGEVVPIDDVMRMRTIGLVNPSRPNFQTTTSTLTSTMQHLGPGEITQAHRHTRTSLYFVVRGDDTATTAEGEEQRMEFGDLLIQPSWTWHGTINRGSESAIWLTIQDTGLINTFEAEFRDTYPDGPVQSATKPDGYHLRRLGMFGTSASLATEGVAFPVKYPWKDALATLNALADAEESDPYDGIVLNYKNPLTGGPTTFTMDCRVQMLLPGEETRSHRHTGNTIYFGVQGSGSALIGKERPDEETLDWGERDSFFIPPWRLHRFRNNSSTEPLILFSVNDHPLLHASKLYRESVS